MHDLAAWAYDNGLCQPQWSTIVNRMVEEFSRAMRADFHVDPQGRRVRTKQVATYERGGKQFALWADLRVPTREPMERSFQQRRQRATVSHRSQLPTRETSPVQMRLMPVVPRLMVQTFGLVPQLLEDIYVAYPT